MEQEDVDRLLELADKHGFLIASPIGATCPWCDKRFIKTKKNRIYCSKMHAKNAWQKRIREAAKTISPSP
jgi:hypothetical protein